MNVPYRTKISPDGSLIPVAAYPRRLALRKIHTGRLVREIEVPGRERLLATQITSSNARIAVALDDSLHYWSIGYDCQADLSHAADRDLRPDQSFLMEDSRYNPCSTLDGSATEEGWEYPNPATFSTNGHQCAYVYRTWPVIRLLNTSNGQLSRRFIRDESLENFAVMTFSPNGDLLAISSSSSVSLRCTTTLQTVGVVHFKAVINSMCFSPDSRTLATSEDGMHQFLDIEAMLSTYCTQPNAADQDNVPMGGSNSFFLLPGKTRILDIPYTLSQHGVVSTFRL